MTTVSSREFASHQDKYFDMAMADEVYVKKGENMFRIMHQPAVEEEPIYFEPDEDFYRSISAEEFRARALEMAERLDRKYGLR